MEVNKKIIIVGAIIIGVLSIGIGTVLLRKPEKTEKPVKNEKTESKKAEIVINAETEYDSFEKVLDKATYAIENADYYELNKITYSISNIGNPMFFSTIKSNVKSTEVVDDRENFKLVKIFLDVTEPGESKLNKGENTKFFYVAKKCLDDKICKEWVISPFFDEVSDEKEAVYYTEDNTDWLECFYECTNFGFGFADDNTYAISKAELGSEFYIDLNNDNIKEKITIEKSMSGNRLYINKDQYTQCSIDFYNKIAFCDIDKEDNFIEIYNYSKLIRFDGKRPYEYLDLLSNINIDDIKGDKKLPVCLTGDTFFYRNLYGYYDVTDNGLVMNEQWMKVITDDLQQVGEVHETKKSIKLYTETDQNSKVIDVKKGTILRIVRVYKSEFECKWIECKLPDETSAYICMIDEYYIKSGNKKVKLDDCLVANIETYEWDERDYLQKATESCDTLIEAYINALNQWDYDAISYLTHSIENGDAVFFRDIQGKVKSYDIIKETDDYKVLKINLYIKNPGGTELKKGKNEKYVYAVKVYNYDNYDYELNQTWKIVPVEKLEDMEIKYKTVADTYPFDMLVYKETYNAGFGIKEEYKDMIYIPFEVSRLVDLDGDKIDDVISIEEGRKEDNGKCHIVYINKGKANEASYIHYYFEPNFYRIYDLDKNDNYKEIIIDFGYPGNLILRYDGKELKLLCTSPERINPAMSYDIYHTMDVIAGDEKYYKCPVTISDGKLSMEWYKFDGGTFVAKKDITMKLSPEEDAESTVVKEGNYLKKTGFNYADISKLDKKYIWMEYELDNGNKVYVEFVSIDCIDYPNGPVEIDDYLTSEKNIRTRNILEERYE